MSTMTDNNAGQQHNGSMAADRAAELAHDTIDRVAERAAGVEHKVRDATSSTAEQVRRTREATGDEVRQQLARLEKFHQERPLATLGLAFAAGIVMSAMLRR